MLQATVLKPWLWGLTDTIMDRVLMATHLVLGMDIRTILSEDTRLQIPTDTAETRGVVMVEVEAAVADQG